MMFSLWIMRMTFLPRPISKSLASSQAQICIALFAIAVQGCKHQIISRREGSIPGIAPLISSQDPSPAFKGATYWDSFSRAHWGGLCIQSLC
ncbi:hypothetical protein EDD18DRAFT_157987 [Armillaria luteobubalina]|uniref:Uncharacterized protein n=1 Tax=Armillaria luteobubalina TaxID=153913 RepID=A0AA39Q773_9AGAR|nr:hypothetical protein EDD18DRAFT_157987 [Armillaria luteobubalina]